MKNSDSNLPRLDTHSSAAYLGCSSYTLKRSRITGNLLGSPAPAFRKLGRKVVYDVTTLQAWLEQFEPKPNTAS